MPPPLPRAAPPPLPGPTTVLEWHEAFIFPFRRYGLLVVHLFVMGLLMAGIEIGLDVPELRTDRGPQAMAYQNNAWSKWKLAALAALALLDLYGSTVRGTLLAPGDKHCPAAKSYPEVNGRNLMGMAAAFCLAFLPAGLWVGAAMNGLVPLEPGLPLLALAGCPYFCMALLRVNQHGSPGQALPWRVLPALVRAGPAFLAASGMLAVLPWSLGLMISSPAQPPPEYLVLAVPVGAYFLLAHARLITLLHVRRQIPATKVPHPFHIDFRPL